MRKPSRTVLLFIAVALVGLIAGCSERTVVPTSFDAYNCKDGNFKIQYPAGWQVESGGKGSYASASFTSGKAQVLVSTSLAGSLMGSMAESGMLKMTNPNVPAHLPPVAAVHEAEKQPFQDDQSVQEQEAVVVQTGLGEGRKAEFRGTNGFGGETRGYRVTTLSRDYRIRVVCQCSAADWDALKPSFDKIIESLGIGKAEL
jgi:hypothetical protein